MPKHFSENYEGDERTYIIEEGDEFVTSYTIFLLAHNSYGLDSWFVLNSLVTEITELEIKKPPRG